MRAATLSGFGQGAGPVLSVRFEPPEQAAASRGSASTMNLERRRILAILGPRHASGSYRRGESKRLRVSPRAEVAAARRPPRERPGTADACPNPFVSDATDQRTGSPRRTGR